MPDISLLSKNDLKTDNLSIYRDLSKNMGQLGGKERFEEFVRKFEEGDCFEDDNYHYGSHYSHPGIIIQNLVRISPYIEGMMSIQNGDIDVADRLFSSVERTMNHALNDISDVRECIPEYFFLPEMFLNLNRVEFGKT